MIFASLPDRDRRALAIGGSVVVLAIGAVRVAPALVAHERDSLAAARRTILAQASLAATVQRRAAVHDSLVARRARLRAADSTFVRGASRAEAEAALARLVSDAAEEAEIQLGSVQIEPDSSRRALLSRATVRASVTGPTAGVAAFIASLESGPTLLAIRRTAIAADGATDVKQTPRLRVELVIEALAALASVATRRQGQ